MEMGESYEMLHLVKRQEFGGQESLVIMYLLLFIHFGQNEVGERHASLNCSLFCKYNHNTTDSKAYENKYGLHISYTATGMQKSLEMNLGASTKFILKC